MGAILVNGQQSENDSLRKKLQDGNLSTDAQIEVSLSLAWNSMMNNADSARKILDRALLLASHDSNYARMGDTYTYMGTSYYFVDNYDSALYFYQKAETYYKKDTSEKASENIATNRMSIGTAHLQRGDHQIAINAYLQAIRILEQTEDHNNLVTAYANTGLVYNDLKQYDKALSYHLKALKISETHPPDVNKESAAQVLMFITLDYLNLKQYPEAETYLRLAGESIKDIKSDYLNAVYYGYKGRYFYETKDYARSAEELKKAIAYSNKTGQQFQKAHALMLLGLGFFESENYVTSISYLTKALVIFQKIGDKIRENRTLGSLSKAYANVKDYASSVKYYQEYTRLNDSLNLADSKKQINEIEIRYQTQRKADSILMLQKNNQIQQLSLRKRKNLNNTLAAGITLLLLIGVLIYRNFRHRHHILKQNGLLHAKRIRELEKEHQLIAAQSLMKGQEEERSRLAKDLHDGVGGLLSGVKLGLSTMKGNVILSEENARSIDTIIGQLDNSITELRRVSHNMMPEALIKYGLKEALENYCESIDQSGTLNVRLQTYGLDQRFAQDAEIILYRIVQELLNNAIKHAEAKQVLVQLICKKDKFTLTVEDDGKGFDRRNNGYHMGVGLQNIEARASYLNGIVDIRTHPGEGTSVTIEGKLN